MFTEEHKEDIRDIKNIVHDALNSVQPRLNEFNNIPPQFLSEVVADAAMEYMAICYDEVKQRES